MQVLWLKSGLRIINISTHVSENMTKISPYLSIRLLPWHRQVSLLCLAVCQLIMFPLELLFVVLLKLCVQYYLLSDMVCYYALLVHVYFSSLVIYCHIVCGLIAETWNVTCIYSQFLASPAPKCCVSLSAFYNSTIVPCPTCSCNCQGLPGADCVK